MGWILSQACRRTVINTPRVTWEKWLSPYELCFYQIMGFSSEFHSPACYFCFLQKGPNKTPIAAICLTSLVTMAFVLVGQVNVLAPIVTINFMLTYIAVDYSYFSLSMVPCSHPQVPELAHRQDMEALLCSERLLLEKAPGYGSEGAARSLSEGTLLEFTKDMDQLLQLTRKLESSQTRPGESNRIPEHSRGKCKKATKQSLQESFLLDLKSPTSLPAEGPDSLPTAVWAGQESSWNKQSARAQPAGAHGGQLVPELSNQPRPSGEGESLEIMLGPPNLG